MLLKWQDAYLSILYCLLSACVQHLHGERDVVKLRQATQVLALRSTAQILQWMCTHPCRPGPKEEFVKPVLTSMDYGWRDNLEKFGKLTLRLR